MKKIYFLMLSASVGASLFAATPAKLMRARSAAVTTPQVLPASDITADGFTDRKSVV